MWHNLNLFLKNVRICLLLALLCIKALGLLRVRHRLRRKYRVLLLANQAQHCPEGFLILFEQSLALHQFKLINLQFFLKLIHLGLNLSEIYGLTRLVQKKPINAGSNYTIERLYLRMSNIRINV